MSKPPRTKSRVRRLLREGSQEERVKVMARDMVEVALRDLRRRGQWRDALKWFNARATVPFGYGWCLALSRYNPNSIRRYIQSLDLPPRSSNNPLISGPTR